MSEAKIDEEYLINNYHKMTVTDLAEHFQVARGTIQRRAKKHGLEKERSFKLTHWEDKKNLSSPLGNYAITSKGRVVNLSTNKELSSKLNHAGYPTITFQVNGVKYYRLIHRLLAEKFIKNPLRKPYVNHIDGDKTNYSITNLEWCTAKENAEHASSTGLLSVGENSGTNTITEKQAKKIKEDVDAGVRTCNIVRKHSFATRTIVQKIKYGIRWKHIS